MDDRSRLLLAILGGGAMYLAADDGRRRGRAATAGAAAALGLYLVLGAVGPGGGASAGGGYCYIRLDESGISRDGIHLASSPIHAEDIARALDRCTAVDLLYTGGARSGDVDAILQALADAQIPYHDLYRTLHPQDA